MKIKQGLKSLILLLLILSSVYLSCVLWIYGQLLPTQRYSVGGMFSILKNGVTTGYVSIDNLDKTTKTTNYLFLPREIAIKKGEETRVVKGNLKQIYAAFGLVKKVLQEAEYKDYTGSNQSEWGEVLKGDGILLDYSFNIGADIFCDFLELESGEKRAIGNFTFSYAFLTQEQKEGVIYFKNDKGEYHKIRIIHPQTFEDIQNNIIAAVQGKSEYSLLANNKDEDMAKLCEELMLPLEQLIPTEGVYTTLLKSTPIEIAKEDSDYERDIKDILSAFYYNPATVSRYENNDGSILFAENFSTLKITKNGEIEYKSNEKTKGISLINEKNSSDGVFSNYDQIYGVYTFANRLSKRFLGGENTTTDLFSYTYEEGVFNVGFSYKYDGIEIVNYQSGDITPQLSFYVKDGYITQAKIICKNYQSGQISMPNLPFRAVATSFLKGNGVKSIDLVYVDDGQSSLVTTSYLATKN